MKICLSENTLYAPQPVAPPNSPCFSFLLFALSYFRSFAIHPLPNPSSSAPSAVSLSYSSHPSNSSHFSAPSHLSSPQIFPKIFSLQPRIPTRFSPQTAISPWEEPTMRASTIGPDLKLETWNLKPARQSSSPRPKCSSDIPNSSSQRPKCSSTAQLERPPIFKNLAPYRLTKFFRKNTSNLSVRQFGSISCTIELP